MYPKKKECVHASMKSSAKSNHLKLPPLQTEDVIQNPGNPDSEKGFLDKD